MYNVLGGKARELADDTEESGGALEAKLDDYYDKTTNAHAAYNLKKWVKTERGLGVSIEKHSAAWLAEMKEIEANLHWDQIKCILYLQSLGPKYQGFFDITANGNDPLDIHDLIKRAADYRRGEETDEADNRGHALAAQEQKTDKKSTDMHSTPCINCGDRYHCAAECFRPGGGLCHLSYDERQDWLEAKRRRREQNRRGRGDDRDRDSDRKNSRNRSWRRDDDKTEEANVVEQLRKEIKTKDAQMETAKEKASAFGFNIGF
jgi:hypothetical protein